MIGGIIILAGLVLAFLDKPHLFKRPINAVKVVTIIIIIGTGITSIIKGYFDQIDQDTANSTIGRSAKTIDSLKSSSDFQKDLIIQQSKIIDSLRLENKTAAIEYQDSLKSFHFFTVDLLAKYGLKVESLRDELSKIGHKDQPHLALLASKNWGFSTRTTVDTFKIDGWIINDGTGQAFGIHVETQLLLVINGQLYRYKWLPEIQRDNYDMVPNRMMGIGQSVRYTGALARIDTYVLVITGFYYEDYERKKKRTVNFAVIYDPKSQTFAPTGADVSKMLKAAKFADFLYR